MKKFIICGRITKDPVLEIHNEKKLTKLSVAVNTFIRKTKEQNTDFFEVVCWNNLAKSIAENLKKGRQVLVEGSLQQDKWTDKEGKSKQGISLRGEKIEFMGKKQEEV